MERTDIEQWKGREVARLLALVETERRYYQEMVATLPVALAVVSSGNVIASANRAFRDLFGVRPDEIRRTTMEQVLPNAEVLEKISEARAQSTRHPSFLVEREGKTLSLAIIPLRNWDDESEVELMLMFSDVTSVREQGRHESHAAPPDVSQGETPQHIETPALPPVAEPVAHAVPPPLPIASFPLENLPAVVWVADAAHFSFTHVSDSAEQMLGYAPSEWMAKPEFFSERIHAEDRDAVLALYRAAIEHSQDVSADFRAHTAAGNVIWCRETIHPSASGTISGVLSRIGARKQLEQQRIAMERYSALQNLSAQLAHDLNNPLMIITGYAEELLHHTNPNDPRVGDLREILTAAERISGITSQLSSFTRHPEAAPESVELASLLEKLKSKIDAIAGGANRVYMNTETLVWASANRERLEEIILGLVSAVHDSAHEKIAVASGTTIISEQIQGATLHPGTYAHITIRNDAASADAAKRAMVFEPVLGKTTPEAVPGTVPTQAYALVHSWGGDLTFTCEASQGSTFTIFLPVAEVPAPVEAAPVAENHQEPAPPVSEPKKRETILVVDDEPGIRALVAKILRRENYDVVEAGNASEAIAAAQTHSAPVQLLLTDVMLPDRSGRQVAEQLSAAMPALKVLYISGFTDDESVRAGEFPPGSRFLQKPFTVGALVGKVREALEQQL